MQLGSSSQVALARTKGVSAYLVEARRFDTMLMRSWRQKPHTRPAFEIGEEDWDTVMDINLKGAFVVAQAVARDMADNGHGGAIVNIASVLGIRVAGNVSSYAASNAGLVQLTKALALEWARHGIRVNALCPGYFETDINRGVFASEAGKS